MIHQIRSSRFFGAVGEAAHEFLLSYLEWLHNLRLVESHKFDYTAFQFDGTVGSSGQMFQALVEASRGVHLWYLRCGGILGSVESSQRGTIGRGCYECGVVFNFAREYPMTSHRRRKGQSSQQGHHSWIDVTNVVTFYT
ncbi:hypothetical protein RDI58_010597 [Solanum bulbocastanum]|uniref:Uncharacterized protein n=1 Tax=Solanum bulbocastanum TaxID=147425 RepID=A0AAN8YGX2_SOLBU